MKFISFKEYLKESQELLEEIKLILNELDEEELDQFGAVLYYEFFYDGEDDEELFEMEDVLEMIEELGEEFYEEIYDLLQFDDEEDMEDMDEAVSRVMKTKNMNKKKRKFMNKSSAELRKTAAKRKRANRMDKMKRRRNARKNKQKIKAYQKSRAAAIKKGKHKVKLRRKSG